MKKSKINEDSRNTNKLRFYSFLKGSFTREPYIDLVKNRSQREWLTRLRISAHHLKIETGRWTRPVTPLQNRICTYCDTNTVDDEKHFLHDCNIFALKRSCFFFKMSSVHRNFLNLDTDSKVSKMLCPSDVCSAKLVNSYIGILTKSRRKIDEGYSVQSLGYI